MANIHQVVHGPCGIQVARCTATKSVIINHIIVYYLCVCMPVCDILCACVCQCVTGRQADCV